MQTFIALLILRVCFIFALLELRSVLIRMIYRDSFIIVLDSFLEKTKSQ